MLTPLQIGYLAGILDGEGSISITRQKRADMTRKRDYGYRSGVRITQRRRILLSTILEWIGAKNGHIGRTGLDNKFFELRFKSDWLRNNLPIILPHLILKRRQAELVVDFIGHKTHVGRNGVGADVWAKWDAQHAECRALNSDRTNALT